MDPRRGQNRLPEASWRLLAGMGGRRWPKRPLLSRLWAALGALLAALGGVLGRSWRPLGPPWALCWRPRGLLFETLASLFQAPAENRENLDF